MNKIVIGVIIVILAIVILGGLLHTIVLGLVGGAIFALGYGTGRASGALRSAERRRLP